MDYFNVIPFSQTSFKRSEVESSNMIFLTDHSPQEKASSKQTEMENVPD